MRVVIRRDIEKRGLGYGLGEEMVGGGEKGRVS